MLLLVLSLLLLLQSCVTAELWGCRYRIRATGLQETAGGWEPRRGTDWSWWRVALRVVATPAALAVDALTLPVQGLVLSQPRTTRH